MISDKLLLWLLKKIAFIHPIGLPELFFAVRAYENCDFQQAIKECQRVFNSVDLSIISNMIEASILHKLGYYDSANILHESAREKIEFSEKHNDETKLYLHLFCDRNLGGEVSSDFDVNLVDRFVKYLFPILDA